MASAPPPAVAAPETPPPPAPGRLHFPHLPAGIELRIDDGAPRPIAEGDRVEAPAGPHVLHFVPPESNPPDGIAPEEPSPSGGGPQAASAEVTVLPNETVEVVVDDPPFGWPRRSLARVTSTAPAHLFEPDGRELGATPLAGVESWAERWIVRPDDGGPDSVVLATSDAMRVRPGEPPPAPSDVVGHPDRAYLRRPILAATASLGACVSQHPEDVQHGTRRVTGTITISTRGRAESVSLHPEEGTLTPEFEQCVLDVLIDLRWRAPGDGRQIGFAYPFDFGLE